MRLLLTILLFSSLKLMATRCNSTGNGVWEAAATWSCFRIPANGDTIYIQVGHTVTVNTNNSTLSVGLPVFIEVLGTLQFGNGSKLNLACGSGVSLKGGPPAGQLIKAGGGGASNQLNICALTVWQASDGNKSGPLNFGSPLPVELLYFTAEPGDMNVTLSWATASEIDNSYFLINRSIDGAAFEVVSKIDGQGTSNKRQVYQYIDLTPPEGLVYYRLSQVDFNGTTTNFDIITVDNKPMSTLAFYPNPTKGDILLTGSYEGDVNVFVFNSIGQTVYKSTIALTRGVTPLPLYSELSAGNFFLKIESLDGSSILKERLIVQ